jgi:hypothetical protein
MARQRRCGISRIRDYVIQSSVAMMKKRLRWVMEQSEINSKGVETKREEMGTPMQSHFG